MPSEQRRHRKPASSPDSDFFNTRHRNFATFSAQGTITNAFIAEARHPSSRILQWKQMEGDFTNAGSTKGQFVVPGASEWFVSGVSPCSHLHRTLVWCTAS